MRPAVATDGGAVLPAVTICEVGAKAGLGNYRPAILDPQVLWNVDELFWRTEAAPRP